jgi:type II secretory pathway component PulK
MMRRAREGFALVMVLWMLTIASAFGVATVLTGREAYNVARNRFEAERAYWRAEGCLSIVRASIDDLLETAPSPTARTLRWRALGMATDVASLGDPTCRFRFIAAGDRLDVNGATGENLNRLLAQVVGPGLAPELVDALLDWRDADQLSQPLGAEADWYAAAHRRGPRDSALASIDELRRIRGFEQVEGLDSLLTVEPGRLSIATAPIGVLAAAPGLTDETLVKIAQLRADGTQIEDLITLTTMISPTSAESLMVRYSDLVQTTTLEPDAWIVSATASAGLPPVSSTIEVRLVRKGNSTAVARLRSNP